MQIKNLIESAGWVEEVIISKSKRGMFEKCRNHSDVSRFCDVVSSHTMRRTAITVMLTLGVNSDLVKKVVGRFHLLYAIKVDILSKELL